RDQLYDVRSRFVVGLRSLRPGDESGVIFAAITGVPPDLITQPMDWGRTFADPRMQDCISGSGLDPTCGGTPTHAHADPGIRMARVAEAMGENGILQSICAEDFGPALDRIVDRLAALIDGVCLPRALVPAADGTVGCDVVEAFVPPSDGSGPQRCADLGGA